MFRTRSLSALILSLGVVLLTGCNGNKQSAAPPSFPPTPVTLKAAATAPIEDAAEFVATLRSLHSTPIQPQIDGQVTQVLVKSGDRVRQGAPLVQIDPRRQQAAVSSQEA